MPETSSSDAASFAPLRIYGFVGFAGGKLHVFSVLRDLCFSVAITLLLLRFAEKTSCVLVTPRSTMGVKVSAQKNLHIFSPSGSHSRGDAGLNAESC